MTLETLLCVGGVDLRWIVPPTREKHTTMLCVCWTVCSRYLYVVLTVLSRIRRERYFVCVVVPDEHVSIFGAGSATSNLLYNFFVPAGIPPTPMHCLMYVTETSNTQYTHFVQSLRIQGIPPSQVYHVHVWFTIVCYHYATALHYT